MAFMPFITAGDPDLATTNLLIEELGRQGVDFIEVGIPYSDPIADGPVIQASYNRALNNKIKVEQILESIGKLDTAKLPPLVMMVSYAIVFRSGPQKFFERVQKSGFSGLIVPDLPSDEAGELSQLAQNVGVDLIQLIAPTTPPERAQRIVETATGFLYCISVAGTTGVRNELPPVLTEQLKSLKSQTKLPLAVGFGISGPDQVHTLRGLADGVIVGSAIVRKVGTISETGANPAAVLKEIGEFAAQMVAECKK